MSCACASYKGAALISVLRWGALFTGITYGLFRHDYLRVVRSNRWAADKAAVEAEQKKLNDRIVQLEKQILLLTDPEALKRENEAKEAAANRFAFLKNRKTANAADK